MQLTEIERTKISNLRAMIEKQAKDYTDPTFNDIGKLNIVAFTGERVLGVSDLLLKVFDLVLGTTALNQLEVMILKLADGRKDGTPFYVIEEGMGTGQGRDLVKQLEAKGFVAADDHTVRITKAGGVALEDYRKAHKGD